MVMLVFLIGVEELDKLEKKCLANIGNILNM
jgi:hypothetical protein